VNCLTTYKNLLSAQYYGTGKTNTTQIEISGVDSGTKFKVLAMVS
jgi:hypothetical protein